jgi:hypothetical protein
MEISDAQGEMRFNFHYGMGLFAFLSGALWVLGILVTTHLVQGFSAGAWITGIILLIFAFMGRARVMREERVD